MKNNTKKKFSGIKSWPENDRLREKLLKKGTRALSNFEPLALIYTDRTDG